MEIAVIVPVQHAARRGLRAVKRFVKVKHRSETDIATGEPLFPIVTGPLREYLLKERLDRRLPGPWWARAGADWLPMQHRHSRR